VPKRLKPGKPLRESLASHHHEPEEEVRTYTERLQHLVEGREVLIFSILAVVILAGGGFGIFTFLRANTASLAAERVSVAYADYRETLFGSPLETGPSNPPWEPAQVAEKAAAIARVASETEGTPAGKLAEYLAGNAYLRAGEPGKALPLLEAASRKLTGQPALEDFALEALGYAQEGAGQPEKALETFQRLAASTRASFRAEGLLGSARMLWAQGKHQEALETYQKARTEFPDYAGNPPAEMADALAATVAAPLEVKTTDMSDAPPAP